MLTFANIRISAIKANAACVLTLLSSCFQYVKELMGDPRSEPGMKGVIAGSCRSLYSFFSASAGLVLAEWRVCQRTARREIVKERMVASAIYQPQPGMVAKSNHTCFVTR